MPSQIPRYSGTALSRLQASTAACSCCSWAVTGTSAGWTVDEPADLDFVIKVYAELYPNNAAFTTDDVLQLLERRPELSKINGNFLRNEGYAKSLAADPNLSTKN